MDEQVAKVLTLVPKPKRPQPSAEELSARAKRAAKTRAELRKLRERARFFESSVWKRAYRLENCRYTLLKLLEALSGGNEKEIAWRKQRAREAAEHAGSDTPDYATRAAEEGVDLTWV
jgi:hypothetical protein